MSFAFPWASTRAARTGLRLLALFFVMALVGMSVVTAATLSPVQNVSNDSAQSILPRVAQGPNGDIHVVWDSNEGSRIVRYAKGTWNGTSYSFGSSHEVANVGGYQYATPAIAVAPNGTVMVAWSDGTLRIRAWNGASSAPGGSAIGLSGGIQPAIYPDANSNFHIAWNGDFRLQYCQWNGSACSNRAAFGDTENAGNRPDIAVDNNNNVHIVWDTGQTVGYRTRAASAVDFSGIQNIGGGNNAQIAADGRGNVHIVRSQDFNIVYCRKTIDTPCGAQHTLDAAQDLQPSIGATRGGNVVIAFRDTTSTVWFDARENGTWQTTRQAGAGLQVEVSARPYTGRVSAVWSQDFDIKHALIVPGANACDVESTSAAVMPLSASAAATRVFLPLISKQPQAPICPPV